MSIVIIPMSTGTIIRDRSGFTYARNVGKKIEAPVLCWLVEAAGKRIIVDTGCNGPEECAAHHMPLVRTEDQKLANTLKRLGVDGKGIELVVLTHLHWDHCYNTELFPNAKFLVQETELNYALNPLPVHQHAYDLEPIRSTSFTTLNGDTKIVEGVTALFMPGHTPGFQTILLEEGGRKAMIASDTIPLYENWGDVPLPNGAHYDLSGYYTSFDRMKKLGLSFILPGHDPEVLKQKKYVV